MFFSNKVAVEVTKIDLILLTNVYELVVGTVQQMVRFHIQYLPSN